MKGIFKWILVMWPVFVFGQSMESFAKPERGFTSWQPASNWEHALLSGNGEMGAMVMGQPHDETIILSHALLYMPMKRSGAFINQASKLENIRQLMLNGKYKEAAKIPVQLRQEQGYNDQRDPFIPAFDVRIWHEPSNIKSYQRSVDYETGEAIVDWKDDKGTFQRRVFVSRADNFVVIYIKGDVKINCTIHFEKRPVEWDQLNFFNEHIIEMKAAAEDSWLSFQAEFENKNKKSIHAFQGLGKLITTNGSVNKSGNSLQISEADNVMLLVRIYPLYDTNFNTDRKKPDFAWPVNYYTLLSPHVAIQNNLFNHVRFSLDADQAERELHAEEILLKAKKTVPAALIEKLFDAGRYNVISATGINPPNLQGIWSGTWTSPWSGSMTNDGNLPVAVSGFLPCLNSQLMHSYFNYHERLLDDYRTSARLLYNCNGIHIPAQETTRGLDTDFGETWCLTFWTGGAGWVAGYFWDYYQYTLDRRFLSQRAYPFMKEAALFYECFLQKDEKGKIIFNPSYSPENNPGNSKSQAVINATMDVMIARQLLTNCIKAAKMLSVDKDKVKTWKKILYALPEYEISQDGTLREWIWKDLTENPQHRHASHLYALFDEVEDLFKTNEKYRNAAIKLIEEKMKFRAKEDGGEMAFGLVQLGLAAAHLGDNEKALQLVEWLASKYWSTGLGSFHNVGHLFNTDISGGLPNLITQMLIYSEIGMISFLPALPGKWAKGSIGALHLRGNIILKQLKWDDSEMYVTLYANKAQKVILHFPFPVSIIKTEGIKMKSFKEITNFEMNLPNDVEITIQLKR